MSSVKIASRGREVDTTVDRAGLAFVQDALQSFRVHRGGIVDDEGEGFLDCGEGSVEAVEGGYETETSLKWSM